MIIEFVLKHGFIVLFLVMMALVALARISHCTPHLGLQNGKLPPCPGSPNCVCSEQDSKLAISLGDNNAYQLWQKLLIAISQQGGRIITEDAHYLHAEFTSKFLGFVDDLEARLDLEQRLIHLRSASRVGYSDMGVNLNRVKQLIAKVQA